MSSKRLHYSDEKWLDLISECRSSGLSDKDWCMEHQIGISTFYYHVKRLLCCLAHARRKFFDAVPKGRQKRIRLLDINSEQALDEPISTEEDKICFLLKKESPSAIVCSSRNVCIRSYLRKKEKQNVLKKKHQSGMNSGPGLTRWIHPEEANWRKRLSMP